MNRSGLNLPFLAVTDHVLVGGYVTLYSKASRVISKIPSQYQYLGGDCYMEYHCRAEVHSFGVAP